VIFLLPESGKGSKIGQVIFIEINRSKDNIFESSNITPMDRLLSRGNVSLRSAKGEMEQV
jgi:hypothetical protein